MRNGGGVDKIIDIDTGEFRDMHLADIKTLFNVLDGMDNIDVVAPLYAHDAPGKIRDMIVLETLFNNTSKHVNIRAFSKENLDILLDISMPITVKLGSAVVPFKQLLQMGPGSVLQLDKVIGEPAELFVQDIKFATADIVVVDVCFAARIREVLGTEAFQVKPDQAAE